MAPEVLSQKPYGPKADVYRYSPSLGRDWVSSSRPRCSYTASLAPRVLCSFGIVLWELITSQVPYQAEGFATLEGPPPNPSYHVLSFHCIGVDSITDV